MDGFHSAHGLGGAKDLPIPAELAVVGAVAALLVSFTVLALAWRTPRFESTARSIPLPRLERVVESTATRVVLRTFGLLALAYCVLTLVAGQDLLRNPIFGIAYVLIWVGIVPLSLAFGPVWKAISPFRTISGGLARLLRIDPDEGLHRYPDKLGMWPAALGLYLFVFFELSQWSGSHTLGGLRLGFMAYAVTMVLGGVVFGRRFLEQADPFEVYSTLVSRLSPWGRHQGRLVLMSPLRNLASTPPTTGLVGVVSVLFGSTAYDSFGESPQWVGFVSTTSWDSGLLNNLAMATLCILTWIILTAATMATRVDPTHPTASRRRHLPALFAHSLVPIVVGYVFAHYFTFLIIMGQDTLILMSNPLTASGSTHFPGPANWFGTSDWQVNNWISYQPELIAQLKVAGVVVGHVVGAVAAHDRALTLLPKQHQVTGQLAMLFAMVVFTAGGLYLLFAA